MERGNSSAELSMQSYMELLQQKGENLVVNALELLGKKRAGCKTQFVPANHVETFNKKHVRTISVVMFLLCVSMSAVYAGIYYTYYWKPCTGKILFRLDDTSSCAIGTYSWKKKFWPSKGESSVCKFANSLEE